MEAAIHEVRKNIYLQIFYGNESNLTENMIEILPRIKVLGVSNKTFRFALFCDHFKGRLVGFNFIL